MSFLKSSALAVINAVTSVRSPKSVKAVAKIIEAYKAHAISEKRDATTQDFFEVVRTSMNRVCASQGGDLSQFMISLLDKNFPEDIQKKAIGFLFSGDHPNEAAANLGKFISTLPDSKYAEKLIDLMLENGISDRTHALAEIARNSKEPSIRRKIFEIFCESPLPDAHVKATLLFYGADSPDAESFGVKYRHNVNEFTPILMDLVKKHEGSPKLTSFFSNVADPDLLLSHFIFETHMDALEAGFSFRGAPLEGIITPAVNLRSAFQQIDAQRINRERSGLVPIFDATVKVVRDILAPQIAHCKAFGLWRDF